MVVSSATSTDTVGICLSGWITYTVPVTKRNLATVLTMVGVKEAALFLIFKTSLLSALMIPVQQVGC